MFIALVQVIDLDFPSHRFGLELRGLFLKCQHYISRLRLSTCQELLTQELLVCVACHAVVLRVFSGQIG